jgi:hypothetical protein
VELPEIVVIGDRPLIDPTTTTGGGNLRSRHLRHCRWTATFARWCRCSRRQTPASGRQRTSVALRARGRVPIDGVNVTDPLKARTSTDLPTTRARDPSEDGRLRGGVRARTERHRQRRHRNGRERVRGNVFGFSPGSGWPAKRHGLLETDIRQAPATTWA